MVITTIQRLDAMLRGEDLDEDAEEAAAFETWQGDEGEVATIAYDPDMPIEMFDFIVTDECHRSIYGLWRQVLEYFDASIIGLKATPSTHTLLRLPTGIWYSPGVKANVLFFDKKAASRDAQTKELWVYDYRTNVHKTLKTKKLVGADLDDFVACFRAKKRKETERFRRFAYDDLVARDKLNLDIFWLKDDSVEDIDNLPEPDVIAGEIVENLEAALEQFHSVAEELQD